jgi:hypothetical protein
MMQLSAPLHQVPADRRVLVFVDGIAGLSTARAAGIPPDTEVRSSAPTLLHGSAAGTITAADAGLSVERREQAVAAIVALATKLDEAAAAAGWPLAHRRLAVWSALSLQNLILKAAALTAADYQREVLVVRVESGNRIRDLRMNGGWEALFSDHAKCQVRTAQRPPAPPAASEPLLDRLRRLRFQGPERWLQRIGLAAWERPPLRRLARRPVLVMSENELVQETVAALLLRGLPVQRAEIRRPAAEPAAREGFGAVAGALNAELAAIVPQPAATAIGRLFRERTFAAIAEHDAALALWRPVFEGIRRPRAILGNIPRSPTELAGWTAATAAGVPFVTFQHGISRELTRNPDAVAGKAEQALSDLFLTYTEPAAVLSRATPLAMAEVVAVGAPRAIRHCGRTLLPLPGQPPILYASTGLYGGSVNIDRGAGNTDAEIALFEGRIVNGVLGRLPHRVLYKTYPGADRYPDPDPVLEAARSKPNITMFGRPLDLRYLLADARVVVTSRATSTLGWCFHSGKPLVFIEVPDALTLRPEARELIRDAVFFFDGRDPGFEDALRTFLSRPIGDIAAEWRTRHLAWERARDILFQAHGPGAGQRAATLILERSAR